MGGGGGGGGGRCARYSGTGGRDSFGAKTGTGGLTDKRVEGQADLKEIVSHHLVIISMVLA